MTFTLLSSSDVNFSFHSEKERVERRRERRGETRRQASVRFTDTDISVCVRRGCMVEGKIVCYTIIVISYRVIIYVNENTRRLATDLFECWNQWKA